MPVALPLRLSAAGLDLSPRVVETHTVAASPTDDAETVIASIVIPGNIVVASGVALLGWGAFTVGASGASVNLRIRQTAVDGTIVAATGATTVTAADLGAAIVAGFDTGPVLPNQTYCLTAEVGSAAAASTFSAVELLALVV